MIFILTVLNNPKNNFNLKKRALNARLFFDCDTKELMIINLLKNK